MENTIISRSYATYQLQAAQIKTSADGKTKYVVANFVQEGLDELMSEQVNGIQLQILPKYGQDADKADAYLDKWVEKAKAGDYTANIGTYEVGGFEPFLRKDGDGKYITTKKDGKEVKTQFKSVFIYWFCDEEGNPLRGESYIIRRGKNLFENSKRIVTIEAYKAAKEKAKAAKEAAEKAKLEEDPLIADADGLDDED